MRGSGTARVSSPRSAKRARWALNTQVVRAIVVFVVLLGLFYGFVHTPANATAAFRPYLALLARTVGGILALFGYDITVAETTVHSPQFSMEIVRGCDAIEPIAIYLAAVLASPVGVWPKLPGILIGSAGLLLINLLRIVSLFYIGIHYRSLFDMLHEQVWQMVFIVLAIAFWAVWVQWATRNERKPPVPVLQPG